MSLSIVIAFGLIGLVVLVFLVGYIKDRKDRRAYIQSLSPIDRERLKGFECVAPWWKHKEVDPAVNRQIAEDEKEQQRARVAAEEYELRHRSSPF